MSTCLGLAGFLPGFPCSCWGAEIHHNLSPTSYFFGLEQRGSHFNSSGNYNGSNDLLKPFSWECTLVQNAFWPVITSISVVKADCKLPHGRRHYACGEKGREGLCSQTSLGSRPGFVTWDTCLSNAFISLSGKMKMTSTSRDSKRKALSRIPDTQEVLLICPLPSFPSRWTLKYWYFWKHGCKPTFFFLAKMDPWDVLRTFLTCFPPSWLWSFCSFPPHPSCRYWAASSLASLILCSLYGVCLYVEESPGT